MPFDLISLFELAPAFLLLPADHEKKLRRLAYQAAQELLSVLEASNAREPFDINAEDLERFNVAKARFVELLSNPPVPQSPLHMALKELLSNVQDFSRLLITGAISKQQSMALLVNLRAHLVQHHKGQPYAAQ